MHILINEYVGESLQRYRVTPVYLAAMTGAGGVIPENEVEYHVATNLLSTVGRGDQRVSDQAEFDASWADFLDARRGSPAEVAGRAYVTAITVGGLTEDEAIQVAFDRFGPRGESARHIVEDTEWPTGAHPWRQFRDAWEWNTAAVAVNMPLARPIHMNRIRVVRNVELVKESGSQYRQPAEIEALFTAGRQRLLQTLRDIPQTFDLSVYTTPEELSAAWPIELPPRE
jgi:hypothetical protein